jgi:hypothetical protein
MLLGFVEAVQATMGSGSDPNTAQGAQPSPEHAMAQAAAQVAQLNQQAVQAQVEAAKQSPKDQATLLLAQAELMDSQTQQRKQAHSEEVSAADLAVKANTLKLAHTKEANRAKEAQAKPIHAEDMLVKTKGMEAMIQGLSEGYKLKTDKSLIEHEAKHRPPPAPKSKK